MALEEARHRLPQLALAEAVDRRAPRCGRLTVASSRSLSTRGSASSTVRPTRLISAGARRAATVTLPRSAGRRRETRWAAGARRAEAAPRPTGAEPARAAGEPRTGSRARARRHASACRPPRPRPLRPWAGPSPRRSRPGSSRARAGPRPPAAHGSSTSSTAGGARVAQGLVLAAVDRGRHVLAGGRGLGSASGAPAAGPLRRASPPRGSRPRPCAPPPRRGASARGRRPRPRCASSGQRGPSRPCAAAASSDSTSMRSASVRRRCASRSAFSRSSRARSASACASLSSRRARASCTTDGGQAQALGHLEGEAAAGHAQGEPVGGLVGVGVVAEGRAAPRRASTGRRPSSGRGGWWPPPSPRAFGSGRRWRPPGRRPRWDRCPRPPRRAGRGRAAAGRGSSPRWRRGGRRRWRGSRRSTARRRCRRRRAEDGQAAPAAAGTCRPDCAMRARRPRVLRATVLPPVLGPLMTRTGSPKPRRSDTGTGSRRPRTSSPSRSARSRHQQGMAGLEQVQLERLGDLGLHGVHVAGEERLGLGGVQLAQDLDGERRDRRPARPRARSAR